MILNSVKLVTGCACERPRGVSANTAYIMLQPKYNVSLPLDHSARAISEIVLASSARAPGGFHHVHTTQFLHINKSEDNQVQHVRYIRIDVQTGLLFGTNDAKRASVIPRDLHF